MNFKTHIFTLALIFLIPILSNGQEKVEVNQKTVTMSKGEQPAYTVFIPESNYEEVVENWVKIIRQNTKSKVEETEHEFIILATEIKEIINKPINLYSAVIKADSSVKIIAAFEIDSVFFSYIEENKTIENEKTHHHIQNFMRDFAIEQYKDFVSEELSEAENLLKTKNKEYKDLSKQIENYQKSIQENEQKIKDSQDLISSYEGENERKQGEINKKKESVASLSGEPELEKQAKSQLKSLEKEKKSLGNKLEKENKNIVEYQSEITEYDRQIEDLLENQLEKKNEIEVQEDVVNSIKTKLAGIK